MKTVLLSFVFSILIVTSLFSQVGIGTTSPNAQLDIRSTNQASPSATDGILVPKVDVFPTGVNANQEAMLVYLTTTVGLNVPGFYYYNHGTTSWLPINKGAEKLDDLSDGKSDSGGTSVFLGLNAGQNDDGTFNENIGLGQSALSNVSSGSQNVAIGKSAGSNVSTGSNNVFLGYMAGFAESGSNKLYIENSTSTPLIYGEFDNDFLQINGTLDINGAYEFPSFAGSANQVLAYNGSGQMTWLSPSDLDDDSINNLSDGKTNAGNNSIFLGQSAGQNDSGSTLYNIGIGPFALQSNTSGEQNVAIGNRTLNSNIDGNNNVAIGDEALTANTSGSSNSAYGRNSLIANTTGSYNTALGYASLFRNINGSNNIAIGSGSLYENISGAYNVALGNNALRLNIDGNFSTAVGFESLWQNNGSINSAYGYKALSGNVGGTHNSAFGGQALQQNVSGVGNVALGWLSSFGNISGSYNVALGVAALRDNINGNDNVSIGHSALINNSAGIHNVAIGKSAGLNNLGSNSVFIGADSGGNETGSNRLYIENSSADSNNSLIYGEFDNDLLRVNGNLEISGETNLHRNVATGVALRVNGSEALWYNGTYFSWGFGGTANYFADNIGIGTATPATRLQVAGNLDTSLTNHGLFVLGDVTGVNISMDANEIMARNNGVVSNLNLQVDGGNVTVGGAIVHASDRRLKKDIEDLQYGLKELQFLQPKQYNWKNRKTTKYKSFGLIAQDVQKIIPELVLESDNANQTLSVNYTELIPILLNAIQEQQEIIESQKIENNQQKAELQILNKNFGALLSRVDALEQINNQ